MILHNEVRKLLVEGYETTHDAKTIGEIFHEDFSHIRKDHAPDNMAVVRPFVLSALKQIQKTKRASMKHKRKIAPMPLIFLLKLSI